MWTLSEPAEADALRLDRLLSKSLFRGNSKEIKRLIHKLADYGEPKAITWLVQGLLNRQYRADASAAIDHLMARISCQELIQLAASVGWFSDWQVSKSWEAISPAKVRSIASIPEYRVSVLGLMSFHYKGHVRQAAVELLGEEQSGNEIPYLLIRQNDWVTQVARKAQRLVASRIKPEFIENLTAAAPLIVHVRKCERQDLKQPLNDLIDLLIRPEHRDFLNKLMDSDCRETRRVISVLALDQPGEHLDSVLDKGISSKDAVIRLYCARRFANRQQTPNRRAEICRQLLCDQFMPVRKEGYLLRSEWYPDYRSQLWQSALLDRSRSIRELGRFHLQDFDFAAFYRQVLAQTSEPKPVIAGLAECGEPTDLHVLSSFLHSARPSIRQEAIRGITRIGTNEDNLMLVPYLADASPRVAREAFKALQGHTHLIGCDKLMDLLSPQGTEPCEVPAHVSRHVLQLIFLLGRWQSLPMLIEAATYASESTSQCAESCIELWFTPPRCTHVYTRPNEDQLRRLQDSWSYSQNRLRPEFVVKLKRWLKEFNIST